MKVRNLFSTLPRRIVAGLALAVAVVVPVSQTMAAVVSIEGTMGVANKTAGDTKYVKSVNAKYNDVVKFEVYYHNRELPDSGKIAQNLRVKIDIPSTAGKTQTQTATIKGDNTNTVTAQTTVNLDRSDAYLQYLPGSAVWRHNTGTNDKPVWTDTVVSDAIVTGGTGVVLENEKPCYNYSATVTVLARVMIPGVSITKQVRAKGTTSWTTNLTATAGQKVEYLITYKNTGNTAQKDVVIGDKLPANVTYVAGTTKLANSNSPSGKTVVDTVTKTGLNIGTYQPGANAFVIFEAQLPAADKLVCGNNMLRNMATAQPSGMNYYYNTADVNINKECKPTPETPVYSCDLLQVTKGANRTVTAKVNYTAKNGASLKMVTYNWGDTKTTSTDKTTASHQYAADGTYKIAVRLLFSVNGKDVYAADNANCAQSVTFTPPTTPPVTPPTTPETPEVLPNTGAGSVIGLFAAVTIAGALLYRVVLGRKITE